MAQSALNLAQCLANPVFTDSDGDGEDDSTDLCPNTPPLAEVDSDGCSLEEFCTGIEAVSRDGRKGCKRADWKKAYITLREGSTIDLFEQM